MYILTNASATFTIFGKTKKMHSDISRRMHRLTARDLLYEARFGQNRFRVVGPIPEEWLLKSEKMDLAKTGIWDGRQVPKATALVIPNGFECGYNQFGITTLIQSYKGGMGQTYEIFPFQSAHYMRTAGS